MRKPGDAVPFGFKADRAAKDDPMEVYYVNHRIGLSKHLKKGHVIRSVKTERGIILDMKNLDGCEMSFITRFNYCLGLCVEKPLQKSLWRAISRQ